MDRQVRAERAWAIPYNIKEILGSFELGDLAAVTLDEYKKIFSDMRCNVITKLWQEFSFQTFRILLLSTIAMLLEFGVIVQAVLRWSLIFCNLKVGIKIATMAANILVRQFKIPFSDYYSIDISPDVYILRVMRRTGLVSPRAELDSVIYKARELCPEFPRIIDFSCWEIGRVYCRPNKFELRCMHYKIRMQEDIIVENKLYTHFINKKEAVALIDYSSIFATALYSIKIKLLYTKLYDIS